MAADKVDWVGRSKLLVFPILLFPMLWGIWVGFNGGLGPDPAKAFVDHNGLWAFRLLLLSLAMTPLRYLTRRSFWTRYRRMLGLFAFSYVLVHVLGYAFLLFDGHWSEILVELAKRPYIIVGGAAFFLLIPLALTSTRGWQKRLGRHWIDLHRLVYPASVLALIHFAWVQKLGFLAVWPYVVVLVALFGIRIGKRYAHRFGKV